MSTYVYIEEKQMKIKTFKAKNSEEFDKLVNDFESEHDVKFTQTHVNVVPGDPAKVLYTAVVFYK